MLMRQRFYGVIANEPIGRAWQATGDESPFLFYRHCERPLGRAAINEYRIPMILVLHTVACHARPVVRTMMFLWVIASVSVAINEHRIPPTKKQKNPHKKRAQSYGEAIAQRRFGFCNL